MAGDGATAGRCITSQAERSCSPDTPMTKGRILSPLDPIAQPSADWMPPILGDQGLHAPNHDARLAPRRSRATLEQNAIL